MDRLVTCTKKNILNYWNDSINFVYLFYDN